MGCAKRLQGALQAIHLLARFAKRGLRRLELGSGCLPGSRDVGLARSGRFQRCRRLRAFVTGGGDQLIDNGQALLTIGASGLVDRQVGLESLRAPLGASQSGFGFGDLLLGPITLADHLGSFSLSRRELSLQLLDVLGQPSMVRQLGRVIGHRRLERVRAELLRELLDVPLESFDFRARAAPAARPGPRCARA